MKIQNLNEKLTLFAHLGVLAGLFLLIVEISQSNNLAETQAFVDRLDQMQEANMIFSTSDLLPSIRIKARSEGINTLTDEERSRLLAWENGVLLRMAGHYYQYEQGYLKAATGAVVFADAVENVHYWEELGIDFGSDSFRVSIRQAALEHD